MIDGPIEERRTDWCTPQKVITPVLEFFRGQIDLDPCSNAQSIVPATTKWSLPENDGLLNQWAGHVYVNPPYGAKASTTWTRRCQEMALEKGCEVIELLPAYVGNSLWQDLILPQATGVCLLKGRLTFLGAPDPARFDSALVLWSRAIGNERFNAIFRHIGFCLAR